MTGGASREQTGNIVRSERPSPRPPGTGAGGRACDRPGDAGHHPPRRSRRLLRLGRAAARPERCAAGRSRSAAAWCWRPRTRRRPSGCAAACRGGGRGSSARTSSSSADTSTTTSGSATRRSRCSATSRRWSSASRSTRPSPTSPAARISSARPAEIAAAIRRRVRDELGLPISVGVARTKHLAKIASQVAKPDGLVVVDPADELEFLHDLPVGLMWGVGPVTQARLADEGIITIGQLAATPGRCARAPARASGRREAARARLEPRSARDPAAPPGALGGGAVGARPAAGGRGGLRADAAPSRRPRRLAAARQGAGRTDGHGAGALRRPARRSPAR